MTKRVRGGASMVVGVQPWRSVDIQFPDVEPPIVEEEKIATSAAGLTAAGLSSSDKPPAIVLARGAGAAGSLKQALRD